MRVMTDLSTDKPTESKGGELASVDTIGVKMTDVKLNRGMILWCDQSVCGRAAYLQPKKN